MPTGYNAGNDIEAWRRMVRRRDQEIAKLRMQLIVAREQLAEYESNNHYSETWTKADAGQKNA